jgi:hypothetical protein
VGASLLLYEEFVTGKPKQWNGSRDSFIAKQRGRFPGNRAGKKASEETKTKIREAKARQAPIPQEARDRAGVKLRGNTVARGRIWITDGKTSRMVYSGEIPDGWWLGRISWATPKEE